MRNRLGLLVGATILSTAVLGGLLGGNVSASPPVEKETDALLRSFSQAFATIQEKYAQEVTSEDLVESAIRGMLRTLDPHSSFFSRRDYVRLQEEQQGRYYGLGITIRAEAPGSGRVIIVEPPVPGTPAYKAGLRAGDVIAKIEGESIDEWDVNEDVIPRLKGPKGTTVDITVERLGEPQPIQFTVQRDEIPLHSIKYAFHLQPGLGYVRVTRFGETTSEELDEALAKLKEQGLNSLILDLRNNPGGSLSQAIEIADRFLDEGESIVSTRSRSGDDRNFPAPGSERYEFPMVILINHASASASEIVAGALQDHDRALIVGETSFGKALVQTIFPLENGTRGLALTTGKYYTPSDRLIQRDYSESFWDYFNSQDDEAGVDESQIHYTDAGRTVYGGGGIRPDFPVEPKGTSVFVRRIQRKDLFRSFVSKLYSGEISSDVHIHYEPAELEKLSRSKKNQLIKELEINNQILDLFQDYIQNNDIAFTSDEFNQNQEVVRNLLKQEILILLFGDEESYRLALALDDQVQKAIELLPRAMTLLRDPESLKASELQNEEK